MNYVKIFLIVVGIFVGSFLFAMLMGKFIAVGKGPDIDDETKEEL